MKETKLIKRKGEQGITLIALVVTIVVLLILAGVTITFVLSDGGILQKAREASNKTGRANVIEMAQLDVVDIQNNNEGRIKDSEFKEVLDRYFTYELDGEELPEDLSSLTLTTKDGKYNDILASEIYNGSFSESTAEETVTIKTTNELKVGEYVYYTLKDGKEVLCQVIYDSSDGGNIEITTIDSLGSVTLGYDDPTIDKSEFQRYSGDELNGYVAYKSWENSVETITKVAKTYENTNFSPLDSTRVFGSLTADRKENSNGGYSVDEDENGEYGLTYYRHSEVYDNEKIRKLECINGTYWTCFKFICNNNVWDADIVHICDLYNSENANDYFLGEICVQPFLNSFYIGYTATHGIKPVFRLNDGLTFKSEIEGGRKVYRLSVLEQNNLNQE